MGIKFSNSAELTREAGQKLDTVQSGTEQGRIRLYHANCILLADTDKHKHVSSASSSERREYVRLCLHVGLCIYEFIIISLSLSLIHTRD